MFKQALYLLLAASVALPTAQAETAEFHYEAPLSDANGSLRVAELPWYVLAHAMQGSHDDLRVLDAKGQAMPTLVRNVSDSVTRSEEYTLNFFRGDDPTQVGLLLKLDSNNPNPKLEQLALADKHYLIIQNTQIGEQYANLQGLKLQWDSNLLAQWLPKTLRVESSNDLQNWQTVSTTQLPYVLKEKDTTIENRDLKFTQASQAKFFRLSGQIDFAPILASLQGVTGITAEQAQTVWSWQNVTLEATKNPQEFQYLVSPAWPIEQWRMHIEQAGNVYTGELKQRDYDQRYGQNTNYTYSQTFADYRLNSELGELRPAAQPLTSSYSYSYSNQPIEWLWSFTQPKPMSQAVQVEFGWRPLELVYLAQGQAPYRLVYGSTQTLEPLQIGSELLANVGAKNITPVTLGTERLLKPLDAPLAEQSWLKYLLWVVLVGAVLMLLWMARHLWRDLNKANA